MESASNGTKGVSLYTAATPNGWKASIVLEELGIPYIVHNNDFSKKDQFKEDFIKINPNSKVPAIVDHDANDLPVWESGALMWYLASKDPEGKLFPKDDLAKQAEVMQWLFFQMSGVGPMMGQANHFFRYAPEKIPYAIERYHKEVKRLFGVMDTRLQHKEWLAADQYSIADIANFCWVFISDWSGVSLNDYPNLKHWVEKIRAREAVKKGLDVPDKCWVGRQMSEEVQQQVIEETRKWILAGKD